MAKIFFLLLFSAQILYLSAQNTLKPEDIMNFQYPGEITVSPGGDQFVFSIRLPDFEKSKWQSHLWMLGKPDQTLRQITFSHYKDSRPRWSLDGQKIAFLSDREYLAKNGVKKSGCDQVWLLNLKGGDPKQISNLENGVIDYCWSQDGDGLILLAAAEKSATTIEKNERRKRLKFDETVKDSLRQNKVFYKLQLQTGLIRKVAELDPGVSKFNLSPDNKWIVYQTNYSGKFNDEQKYDLWCVNLRNGEKHQLTVLPGPETDPKFSPDGKWIAFITQTTPDVEFAETDLNKIRFPDFSRKETATNLTREFDLSVTGFEWEKNSKKVLLQVAKETETHLYSLNTEGKKNSLKKISPAGGNILDIISTGRSANIFCKWEDSTHLPEIIELKKNHRRIVSDFSEQLQRFDWGTQKVYRWNSVDGKEIEGLLFLPPNFDSGKKYPLILTVHGGPYGRFRQAVRQHNYPQLYTTDGFVVFAPNPRGSSGYDDNFGKAIWYKKGNYMGGIDYQDIMSGVDALISEDFIDESRMGVTGGSYGGYLTNWIISQTDRFAAAVSQFGIFSLFTDWSNSWQPSWEKMYFGIYYWEQPMSETHPYVKHSPAFYVKNIQTPVLILHGEDDKYTNLANSQEMYQALKTLGRDVEFVVYPRENHGIGKEPNHRLDSIRRTKKWFEKYLGTNSQ